jgi:hypothetical protein
LIGFSGYSEKLEKLREFATARSLSMVELAIAWLLSEAVVASVIAGATSTEPLHKMLLRWENNYQHWTGWNWTGCSGEVQPWRTNLSKIGEVSREVLLLLLGAVRLSKNRGSRFPCGNISRADHLDVCTSAAYA